MWCVLLWDPEHRKDVDLLNRYGLEDGPKGGLDCPVPLLLRLVLVQRRNTVGSPHLYLFCNLKPEERIPTTFNGQPGDKAMN
ncbi:hypothetical protein HGM15179_010139 [Zosterops borbonicus]|uniref:Uncharacterized protein n=1 Tax=Zosterops borbonicus TaxID=364589 RepID=A0A8K1GEV9_9PASS|nr:hypothetical protein HGM15179_010139 [Zosterops borbonicus]